jgi:hypothetical protein
MRLWDYRRATLVQVRTGITSEARRHARLLAEYQLSAAAVGRPGFALLAQRTREQYEVESAYMRGAPAVGYHRFGNWLAARHNVTPPNGWTSAGTVLYLAEADVKHLVTAARALEADASANRITASG